MSTEDWKLQVSYKVGSGDMINIRANTADELSVLLENIGDYATQIAATQRQLATAVTVSPLSTSSTAVINTAPGANSVRYGSSVIRDNGTDMRTRTTQIQVGNQSEDRQSILDVGLSDATGSRAMQASKLTLENEVFPF
jgi:hypothetical protein